MTGHTEQHEAGELLPCPNPWCIPSETFVPTLIWRGSEAVIECASCGMQGPGFSPVLRDEDGEWVGTQDAESLAITAWNTRTRPTPAPDSEALAKVIHENGPVVLDFMGEEIVWRPLDYGTWSPLATLTPTPNTEPAGDSIKALRVDWNKSDLAEAYDLVEGVRRAAAQNPESGIDSALRNALDAIEAADCEWDGLTEPVAEGRHVS